MGRLDCLRCCFDLDVAPSNWFAGDRTDLIGCLKYRLRCHYLRLNNWWRNIGFPFALSLWSWLLRLRGYTTVLLLDERRRLSKVDRFCLYISNDIIGPHVDDGTANDNLVSLFLL